MSTTPRRFEPPADLPAEPGWTPIEGVLPPGVGRGFVNGDPTGDRLRVRYFRRDADGALVGRAWFGPGAEGPPAHVHGGAMAAVLDEVMGLACWIADRQVVAGRINIGFHAPLPLGSRVTLEGWIERVTGTRLTTRARLVGPDGTVHAKGEGLFIELGPEAIAAMLTRTEPKAS